MLSVVLSMLKQYPSRPAPTCHFHLPIPSCELTQARSYFASTVDAKYYHTNLTSSRIRQIQSPI
jgi:hypothetical protein